MYLMPGTYSLSHPYAIFSQIKNLVPWHSSPLKTTVTNTAIDSISAYNRVFRVYMTLYNDNPSDKDRLCGVAGEILVTTYVQAAVLMGCEGPRLKKTESDGILWNPVVQ